MPCPRNAFGNKLQTTLLFFFIQAYTQMKACEDPDSIDMRIWHPRNTLPETKMIWPGTWFCWKTILYFWGPGLFSGANSLLVSGMLTNPQTQIEGNMWHVPKFEVKKSHRNTHQNDSSSKKPTTKILANKYLSDSWMYEKRQRKFSFYPNFE